MSYRRYGSLLINSSIPLFNRRHIDGWTESLENVSVRNLMRLWLFPLFLILCRYSVAQMPETAQTDIYFPHLADGGPAGSQWQSRFTFINPSPIYSSTVTLNLYTDSGGPLALDLGNGPNNQVTFDLPPNGTYILSSRMASSTGVTGWAIAYASLPVEASLAFRLIQNGTAKLEITAAPTLPSTAYRSVANPQVGIAIDNVYVSAPLSVTVTVYGASGQIAGQVPFQIPPMGHTSFNLGQSLPSLPAGFIGSLVISPQMPGQVVVAWVLYADSSGVISSLPEGRAGFPLNQVDQINEAFNRLANDYHTSLPDFGSVPQLVISPENDSNAINAFASNGTTVQINLALAELISDSPSELAFVIGHELAHIYQQRTGKFIWNADPEWDADAWGLLMSFGSGYDPYAAAGALGKLSMATGTANLGVQLWEDSQLASDAHGSFSTRINNLSTMIETMCSSTPTEQANCSQIKAVVHPHLPASPLVPLIKVGPSVPGTIAQHLRDQDALKLK